MMGVNSATLNHYLQIFAHRYDYYYQSGLQQPQSRVAHGHDAQEAAHQYARERMSSTHYQVIDKTITRNLGHLVRFVIKDSDFFKGLDMFYYLFFRWHRIDYSHLEQVKVAYRSELMNVLRLLEERRMSFDAHEVSGLLDEYFEYYALFISDPQVIDTLDYSYYSCYHYNSSDETHRLLNDLWAVHRAFYRQKGDGARSLVGLSHERPKAAPTAAVATTATTAPTAAVATYGERFIERPYGERLIEQPCVPDRLLFAGGTSWAASFEYAFASVIERGARTDKALARLRQWSRAPGVPFSQQDFENTRLLLETANMTPSGVTHRDESVGNDKRGPAHATQNLPSVARRDKGVNGRAGHTPVQLSVRPSDDTMRYNSNIHYYDAVDENHFVRFEGLDFALPYYPLIDSTNELLLRQADFVFQADPHHTVAPLEVGPFKPLLETLSIDSRHKAINAGYSGISEYKIYLYEASINPSVKSHPRFVFRAGKSDYFTGIARKDLFARFLVPSVGNLRHPLVYLLDRGLLPRFVACEDARKLQRLYDDPALESTPGNVRLTKLFAKGAISEQVVTDLLRYEINRLYTEIIAPSARRDEDGSLHFLDNGSTYTGCGVFVLTADTDEAGNDRPLLLLEKRWKVSEENDNLSYPSGGSCDFYTPLDNVPFEREDLKGLEADPFKTAARELHEELNILTRPDDLTLISFGIDVNRNLQQFSFLYESPQTAQIILERKRYAGTPREGFTFTLPFDRAVILDILNNYQIEAGAIYSLMRLMDLKAARLWR
jgi:hypothetical protein